jgi:hypothetical protein
MMEQSSKNTRGMAGATLRAKSAGPAIKDDMQRGAAGQVTRKVSGSRKPSGPSRDEKGHENVRSVAELAMAICEDPDTRKKRLKLAEALRERGLDESTMAAMYSGLAKKLSCNKEAGAAGMAVAKLLFDVLKELAHWLEPQKTTRDGDASEAPQFVRLIHNVPRPVRTE